MASFALGRPTDQPVLADDLRDHRRPRRAQVEQSAAERPFSLLSGGLIVVYEVGIALLVSGGLTGAVSALDEIQQRLLSGGAGREGA